MTAPEARLTSEAFGGSTACHPACRWLVRLLRPGRTQNAVVYPFPLLYRIAVLVADRPVRVVRIGAELVHPRRSDTVPATATMGRIEHAWVDEDRRMLLGVVHLVHGPNRLRQMLGMMERRGLVRTVGLSLVPRDVQLADGLVVADVRVIEAVDVVTEPASDASFVRSLGPTEYLVSQPQGGVR